MALPPAISFTLTDAEAAALQNIQMLRQARIGRRSPILLWGSIATPFIVAGVIWLADQSFFAGEMPGWLFIGFMWTFVAGMFYMAAGYWATLIASKRRMRSATRQYFEPRQVRLTGEGIEQSLPALRQVQMWQGISGAEEASGLILVWAGNLPVAVVPVRAFASPDAASAFLAACNARAGDTGRSADASLK